MVSRRYRYTSEPYQLEGLPQTGDRIKIRCHLLRDGSPGCLLGFITPDHGDMARGHGVEREWTKSFVIRDW